MPTEELEELRVDLERIRTLLENLVVRGLRACGPDEMAQLAGYVEHLDRSGAGHLATTLADLKNQIERDERTSASALLLAQTNVRLLERLLTLRVVRQQYALAVQTAEHSTAPADANDDDDDEDDEVE